MDKLVKPRISDSLKKKIAKNQDCKCARKPYSRIPGLEKHSCCSWARKYDEGKFYNKYVIIKLDSSKKNTEENLIALCIDCYDVLCKRYNRSQMYSDSEESEESGSDSEPEPKSKSKSKCKTKTNSLTDSIIRQTNTFNPIENITAVNRNLINNGVYNLNRQDESLKLNNSSSLLDLFDKKIRIIYPSQNYPAHINIFSEPYIESRIIGYAHQGDVFNSSSKFDNDMLWTKIFYNNQLGFIKSQINGIVTIEEIHANKLVVISEKSVTVPTNPLNANPSNANPSNTYPPNTYPANTYPSNTYPANTYPPNTYPPNTYPPNTYPANTYPANTYPPNTYPPNTYPPNTYPPNTYPPNTYPPNTYPANINPSNTYPANTYPPDTYPANTYPPNTYPANTYPPNTNPFHASSSLNTYSSPINPLNINPTVQSAMPRLRSLPNPPTTDPILRSFVTNRETVTAPTIVPTIPPIIIPNQPVENVTESMIDSKNNTVKCCICFEAPPNKIALVPCGHTSFCSGCIGRLREKKCPICMQHYKSVIPVFD